MPGRDYQSSLSFPYGYQGQEKDPATGLTNFELRQYDPRIGRWYNPDPYMQHHSPYLAMSNNPISNIDPDGGTDYEIDGMPVSQGVYNVYAGNSGNVGSVSYGGLSYGSVIGYSYNGEDSYGSQGYQNALSAQLAHWGQLGIMSDGRGNFYQKYNYGLIGNYGSMKGGAGLEDMTDLANAVLDKNRAEQLSSYYSGSAKFAWEHGNYTDWAEYKLKGALGEDYDKKVEKAAQPFAQAMADLNPIMNASHIITGLATGENSYGDKMTGSGYAWAAVGMIPFGAEAKGATGAYYSVAFETEIASSLYPGVYRGAHFKAANEALEAVMKTDAAFARSITELGIVVPKSATGSILAKSPSNWVWHHDIGAGIMQLVPKVQHTTGSIFWNTMHPGGVGGFYLWGR